MTALSDLLDAVEAGALNADVSHGLLDQRAVHAAYRGNFGSAQDLVRKFLPDASIKLRRERGGFNVEVEVCGGMTKSNGDNLACALLIATLRALVEKEKQE